MNILFRAIPAVDKLMEAAWPEVQAHFDELILPRTVYKNLVNTFLDNVRADIRLGTIHDAKECHLENLIPELLSFILTQARPHLRRLINATGVVVHTNMGRSLLSTMAIGAVTNACQYYSNLELDLTTGERGSRYSHIEDVLCQLTGAEAALVVNNNAAAVLLVLDTLGKEREVIVSRGQLVEIGGSFRIPEIMEKSGAILKEVGATNRTHVQDYEKAINEQTAALLKVHTSNYRILGFSKEVKLEELRIVSDRYHLPLIEDLGSGNFITDGIFAQEPTVEASIRKGADIVTFSGDKVLGGPQAGLIVGKSEYLKQIKKNPLHRALRVDKMTLAALETTLRLYLDPELARREIPTLRMVSIGLETLKSQAGRLSKLLQNKLEGQLEITTKRSDSRVGGGAYPEKKLPTVLVCIRPLSCSTQELRRRLLCVDIPLITRLEDDTLCLDPRTIHVSEHKMLVASLIAALDMKKHKTRENK